MREMTWAKRCLFSVVLGAAPQSAAQEVLHWQDFRPCGGDAEAELVLHEVVRLGDAEGDGIIERDMLGVLWGKDAGYLVVDNAARFKVFGDDGEFVRAVGRAGDGPGEFDAVTTVHVVGEHLVALDAGRRAWLFFELDGEFVVQRNLGLPTGRFVPVGGTLAVVAALDRRPNLVGYPLHLVDLADGAPSLHFGAEEPANWKATDPHARRVVVGPASREGAVWGGKAGIPTAQEWSVDGQLLRSIEGELPWFPRLDRHPDPRRMEPPGPQITEIMADSGDRLWMETLLADERWRETMSASVSATGGGEPFFRPDDLDALYDVRLDGFDLARKCHLGRYLWDGQGGRLFDRGGEAMVQLVAYDDPAVPRIVVHRISWP